MENQDIVKYRHPSDYLKVFFRRKWLFITPVFLGLVVGIILSYTLAPTYVAYTVIMVEEEKLINPLIQGLAISTDVAQRMQGKEIESFKGRDAAVISGEIARAARDISGVKAVAFRRDGIDAKDLRILADNVRDALGSGILVIASVLDNQQASMVAMVTMDLTTKFSAGTILKEIAAAAGGKGGGKADTAQGGTKEIKLLDKALESLYDIVNRISQRRIYGYFRDYQKSNALRIRRTGKSEGVR